MVPAARAWPEVTDLSGPNDFQPGDQPDLSSRDHLINAAAEELAIADAVVLDGAGVRFIDACGVEAFVEIEDQEVRRLTD